MLYPRAYGPYRAAPTPACQLGPECLVLASQLARPRTRPHMRASPHAHSCPSAQCSCPSFLHPCPSVLCLHPSIQPVPKHPAIAPKYHALAPALVGAGLVLCGCEPCTSWVLALYLRIPLHPQKCTLAPTNASLQLKEERRREKKLKPPLH